MKRKCKNVACACDGSCDPMIFTENRIYAMDHTEKIRLSQIDNPIMGWTDMTLETLDDGMEELVRRHSKEKEDD